MTSSIWARNAVSYGLARRVLDMMKFLQGAFLMTTCLEKVGKSVPVPPLIVSHLL